MLALAMALIHDPEILIIDELSLGLAPVVVADLLAVIEELRLDGLAMIIVEQSLNVALALSDRAIFLEKGQVRFEGSARELAERDDLARAVFLGRGRRMIAASWVTPQLLVDGVVNGLVIGLIALGVVLVYRSTRVINFAVGNMGIIGAALLPLLTLSYGWPFWPALVASLLVGMVFALLVELVVIRRLFEAARVTVLVATIGVAQLAIAIVAALPKVKGVFNASYPVAVDTEWTMGDIRLTGSQLTIVVVVPLAALGLSWFLNRTTAGHAITASADNARLARTVGISPKVASTVVWVIAGLLSTVSMIMISGPVGRGHGADRPRARTRWCGPSPPRSSPAWCRSGGRSWPASPSGWARRWCASTCRTRPAWSTSCSSWPSSWRCGCGRARTTPTRVPSRSPRG